MRKWLAGWLSWAADRLYPHYSERMRRPGDTFDLIIF